MFLKRFIGFAVLICLNIMLFSCFPVNPDSVSVPESAATSESNALSAEAMSSTGAESSSAAPESSENPEPSRDTASSDAEYSPAPSTPESSAEASIPAVSAESSKEESSAAESSVPEPSEEESSAEESRSNESGVWKNDLKGLQDTEYHGYSTEALDGYFSNSLFVGDSQMNGFKTFVAKKQTTDADYWQGAKFFCAASYGFNNAMREKSSTSVHPLYQGTQKYIWEMTQIYQPDAVYIEFGLNDFGYMSDDFLIGRMDALTEKIHTYSPDVRIVFLSAGYFTKEGEVLRPAMNDYRTNERNRERNQTVLDYCNQNGYDYIDVSNFFTDDYGYLIKDITLDNYCHITFEQFENWVELLRGYAADKMNGTYHNIARMK